MDSEFCRHANEPKKSRKGCKQFRGFHAKLSGSQPHYTLVRGDFSIELTVISPNLHITRSTFMSRCPS
ncbi:hypothetical protein SAMN06265222_10933 [Neorhodopirellula lusitana]|uniref:Uncharacterized protein n=1 Tax=Neorhodopirellula lusitana TaxID=445327 RepID=A0ABY1QE42_9BACT|nr:hypothetical protein SAMN06265222_10933 [Neorhodopirellula lusitana]